MNPPLHSELKTLAGLGGQSNDKLYAWLRWLILLAAGFFSLMAGQLTGKAFPPLPLLLLKLALGSNAAGILAGAAALYGEVAAARRLARMYKEGLAGILQDGPDSATSGPVVAKPPWFARASERLCYLALTGSLLAWGAFVFLL